jgi:GcrA cell cycle regulator
MSHPPYFDWTPAATERLRALHATGLSFSKIAAQIGCSANSAISKAHSLDLPARPPAIQSRGALGVRTPERTALLRELYQTPIHISGIVERINALPGKPISGVRALRKWANECRVTRPNGVSIRQPASAQQSRVVAFAASRPMPPAPPAQVPIIRAAPGVALPPVPRTWSEIVTLAYHEGREVRSLDDLVTWNKRRIERGVSPLCPARDSAGRMGVFVGRAA